ncbi:hypothetical protein [Rhizohabitans arisaemae]|uniref:hypothetical protein n=1 Tax=Rhizohabitans arisaemae TaxID=2720610 RepID=UPI0024B090D5|nr:hypothetical protein [Rhizohabitans arisaemae]
MRIRTIFAATAFALAVSPAMPAAADDSVNSTITFVVNATGGLDISAPAAGTLFATTPGNPAIGQLGNVSVVDNRSTLNTTWTATIAVNTPFSTGTGSPAETITNDNVVYSPGTAINPVNGPFTAGAAGSLAAARTAFTRPAGSGNNSVGWNPTFTVNVPATAVLGTYNGVVTHSVA